jgi:hypothetical protein
MQETQNGSDAVASKSVRGGHGYKRFFLPLSTYLLASACFCLPCSKPFSHPSLG